MGGASSVTVAPPRSRPIVHSPRHKATAHDTSGGASLGTCTHPGSHAHSSGSHGLGSGRLEPQTDSEESGSEREGKRVAMPVVYNWHGANPRWEPFPISHLKDLGKVAKEFGRDSPRFQTVLSATLSSTILVPGDLKTIMKSPMVELNT